MESQRATKKKISDDLTTCRGNSDHQIPLDLIPDILKGLPVQTLARFLCVSKLWSSIIRSRGFKKSYLIKSSTVPQTFILTFEGKYSGKRFFFSLLQPQNPGYLSSSVATYLMKYHSNPYTTVAPSVHGLICYGPPSKIMVYNPSTRRSITLPKIDSLRVDINHFLGYDPIGGDYKVLSLTKLGMLNLAEKLWVLTLGNGDSWRMIKDFPPHYPDSPEICINGVLYYQALLDRYKSQSQSHVVMSFDVRSEKFEVIKFQKTGVYSNLTSYKGKLAILFSGRDDCSTNMWVLEDAAKHEWSKQYYVVPIIDPKTRFYFYYPFCVTHAGEIVFASKTVCEKTFDVIYYHPKKNTVRRVYIEGITELKDPLWDKDSARETMSIFSGQVDNLMFL